jgi:GTP pyrophosphokinase
VNGKIVPLHYELQSGDIVEILTSKRERGPSRDWLALVKTTRARNKIKAWFKAESRDDSEHTGRELLQEHLNKAGLPAQKLTGSPLLADVIRELGFKKADDFYIALGGAKVSPKVVVNKVMQRLKQGEAGVEEPSPGEDLLLDRRKAPALRRPDGNAAKFGIRVEGVSDVPLRLAKCCRPVSGDPIVGYVSLGRGITIHREDCPNVAEAGINIIEARCLVTHPMTRNRFVIEVGDTQALKSAITRLRAIDGVFDAYRVIPAGG